jgi:hypothetical protein
MDFLNFLGDPVTLIGSLIVIFAAGYYIYSQQKQMKESGLPPGEYINEVLLQGHITWVLVFILFVSIAESLMAASIHPGGQQQINVAARFVAHLSVNMSGTLMNIMLAQRIVELVMSFNFLMDNKKAQDPRYYMLLIIKIVNIGWVGFAALGIPYLNYITIAQGLGELQNAKWAVRELLGQNLMYIYQAQGLPADYSPLSNLSYIMFASLGAMIVHYMLAIYDGFSAVASRLERELESPVKVMNLQEDIRRFATNPSEGIKYLISMAGHQRDKNDMSNIANQIVSSFASLEASKRAKIARNLATFVSRWKSLEANERGGKQNDAARRTLIDETLTFFRKSSAAGGLDRALSNRRRGE